MTSSLILAGLGLAAIGFTGRALMRNRHIVTKAVGSLPLNELFSKYDRGGFEARMSRTEAAKILGVSTSARLVKIKEAHRRVMIANHPDRGGSPYLAAKVNEAKDKLEAEQRRH